jgi:type VI secretion system secreted protein VgrG
MSASDKNQLAWLKTSLPADKLLFAGMTGTERLSTPYEFEVSMLSDDGGLLSAIDAHDDLLGRPMAVAVRLPSADDPRFFQGIVTDFSQVGWDGRFHQYRATLRPWFWLLTRTSDCRIFQAQSVLDIFEKVVKEYGFTDFDIRGVKKAGKAVLEYCVQYRETDFNFLSRLLEQAGIHYFFKHTATSHTMMLADEVGSGKVAGYERVPFYPPANESQRERDNLASWQVAKAVQPGSYATTDYDFEKPGQVSALLRQSTIVRNHAQSKFEMFDYPAEGSQPTADQSEAVAKVRIEELQSDHYIARGEGTAIGLAPGHVFELVKHPHAAFNDAYYVTGAGYVLSSNSHESGTATELDSRLSLEAVPSKVCYRPARVTPKPVVQGAQTAVVVGKSGEEIYTDKHGRVKVQFHWDRYGKRDENSSCWIRVSHAWAGKQWGAIHTPRIGQEVIVSFLEGDPDRPLITGRVYNEDCKPPYALPDNLTQSGIKSHSSKSGGEKNFNEIRFEDKKGSEELVLHAEKDLKVDVENDATWRVGLDEDSPAKNKKGAAKALIGKTLHVDVGDEITFVTGDSKIVMKKNGEITIECIKLFVKTQQLIDMNSQKEIRARATNSIDMDANLIEISGQKSAKLEAAKVEVKGLQIEVNAKVGVKVTAGASVDVSGGAMATLKGGIVKIN